MARERTADDTWTPTGGAHSGSRAEPGDPVSGWFAAGAAMCLSWLQWQGGVWRSYRDLQVEWMLLYQDRVCDCALCLGALRGAEQLA